MITVNSSGNPLSAAFISAVQQPSVGFDMRLYLNGADTGAGIKRARIDLGAGDDAQCDLSTFDPAQIMTTQFEADIYGASGLVGDELEVRIGVWTGSLYEYVTVAWATITDETEWQGIVSIRGKGRMGLMFAPHGLSDGDYSPASICTAISAATGVTVTVGAFQSSQNVHIDAGGTCRDAIASMCARLGGYACELGAGVSVLPYDSSITYAVPDSYITGRPEVSPQYQVDGLTVRAGTTDYVYGTGRAIIEDPTADGTTSAVTWGNISGYAYDPAILRAAIIDPRVTPADTIGYNSTWSIPARGISATFDGGYFGTYSASGLTAESEEELVDGPLTSRVADAYQLALEAEVVAQATGQHFWHDSNGAHVSTDALDPTGTSNSLWNSLGLLIRKAANNLVSITQSAIAFFDGNGNNASNIVASFGSSGFQVGYDSESHLEGDYHSLQMIDKEGSPYVLFTDLRDSSGYATITDTFTGDGSTTFFSLSMTASSNTYTVKRNGTTVTSGITKTTTSFTFSTAPASGVTITATYTVNSQDAKAFTLGTRGAGNVGGMSFAAGHGCVASGYASYSEGSNTVASGKYSHAEGANSTAGGYGSHAEGSGTTALYGYSHAEGHNSEALAEATHAEGDSTVASGNFAHAEGWYTEATGAGSHAQNYGTVAASDWQTAIGQYNITDSADKYAFIIGNGDVLTPSNAMTVDWDGAVAGLTFNGFRGRKNVASTDNIDEIYNTGIYYVGSTAPLGTAPPFGSTYYSLIAMGGGAEAASTYVGKQIAVSGSGMAYRSYSGNPRSWSPWVSVFGDSVNVHNPTLNSNATATTFQTRRVGNVVNLSVYQLKVASSLADGSSVSLGTGIIGANARPTNVVYLPLVANVSGKGAGVLMSIGTGGNVTIYNRSGSALGTGTNLMGNTTWVI